MREANRDLAAGHLQTCVVHVVRNTLRYASKAH
jgi:transposase-like protein